MEEDYNLRRLEQLEEELIQAQQDKRELAKSQLSLYQANNEDNIVKWQLNLEEEKERIFHLLKGDRKVINQNGEEYWEAPLNPDSIVMNDYGIDYVMGLFEAFVNRNIILSNFDEDRIKEICLDLSEQITLDLYNDYEKMGLNTEDKRKKASMVVWKVIINIEATLRRAMGGRENLNLRKIITVTQNDNANRGITADYPLVNTKRRKIWSPSTW